MDFFGWISRIFSGPPRPGPNPPAQSARKVYQPGPPGICGYCGARLVGFDARQCLACGHDWHDPSNVVQRGSAQQVVTPSQWPVDAQPPATPADAFPPFTLPPNVAVATGPTRPQQVTPPVPPPSPSPPAPRKPHAAPTPSELDVSSFAPISDSQAMSEARGARSLWGNPWFGRRDLIPPANDPRTSIIDRGMAGHGFLSPEELAEIHAVGAQMDLVRPDLAMAHQQAQAAVARSEEERAEIKRQKKEAAAEKKRQRAAAIAERRATDIVFLGRDVSRGLSERHADVARLGQLGLPALATPSDVAAALSLSIARLRWLAFHSQASLRSHYVRFQVPKKSGGARELAAPHRSMRAAQDWILGNILSKVPLHAAAHGFVPTRSTLTGAKKHVGKEVIVNIDLADFFASITFPRVKGTFQQLGYSPAAATILALLCTECPRRQMIYAGQIYHVATGPRALPQGASTSPALSNLVARRLDSRLAGIAARLGFTYTRYADDLTFSASGDAATKVGYLLARIRHIAQDEGFAVNEKKTRVLRRNSSQRVTGIVVNDKPGVPRAMIRRIRSILHRAKREGLAAQNREQRPHFESWLAGMIGYIAMVNPEQGAKLKAEWAELHPPR